jgi:DNA-binding NarL/FixJ family response regulator
VISVLIAEDHQIVREGLAALLRGAGDVKVVAEVADGEAALGRIEALRPKVAVLDIAMPGMTGIEVARKVRDAGIATATVLLSMHREAEFVRAALDAGASGYVLKTAGTRELVDAIRVAAEGDVYLSPQITSIALAARAAGGGRREAAALTPRERDVLRLLARGLSSKEIAASLAIGARTVDTHRADIMDKLGVRSVPGLVKYAIRSHLATLDE